MKTFASEIWGLFVDDGALAVGLLVWCAAADLLPVVLPESTADAVVFFLGCAVVLFVNLAMTVRRARPSDDARSAPAGSTASTSSN
jgi:hypothetical protein